MKLLKLKAVLWMALLVPIWISSCVQEGAFDSAEETLKEGEVKMIIKLKTTDGFAPQSKGLTETEESDIRDVLVFAFRLNKLSYIKEASSVDNSTQKSFTAILNASASSASSNNYNLMILANAKTTVTTDTWGALINKSYAEVQAALHKTITGKMYPEASGESIIMWGETGYVNITPEFTPPAIQLLRSVARIDVGVNSNGTNWLGLANFTLKSVSVYRSNKSYALVPLVDNRTTEGGNIKVTAPSDIPSKNEIDAPLTYAVENNKLSTVREIYVSESNIKMNDTGISGDQNHLERMALVIGGSYAGGTETFYRVDFLSGAGKTLADVLRNHHYQFNITQVVGAGYATPKEAYQSRAINMSVEVVEWNDATLEDIVFDGQYYLTISQKRVKFNQFGEASENNIITIKTNGGALAIEGFTETTPNSGTYKDPTDYFTITKTGTNNGAQSESVYTLTATAKPATAGDPLHEAVAKIKVRNINTSINLYQELFNPFRLETHPANNSLINIDDAKQLIEVKVSSTADYKITSDYNLVLQGCYSSKNAAGEGTGTFHANGATIPAATKTVYLQATKSETNGSRVESVVVKHADGTSTANSNTLVVIQENKYITATLLEDSHVIPEAGGTYAIQINTNLKHWTAKVTETGGTDFATISANEGGIGTSSIMLKMERMTGTDDAIRTATIEFTNADKTITENLVVTQNYIKKTLDVVMVGGSTVIPEAGGSVNIKILSTFDSWTAEVIEANGTGFATISANEGGFGTSTVSLTFETMTGISTATRSATIRFTSADNTITKDVVVTQNYTEKTLTATIVGEHRITSAGGTVEFEVVTTLPTWSVTDDAAFATTTPAGGTAGTSTVSVRIDPINDYVTMGRTATIKFQGSTLPTPVVVEIYQSKKLPPMGYSGAPNVVSINKFGELILTAEVGDPETSIVYFKLGSLIGVSSKKEDRFDGTRDIVYNPTEKSDYRSFSNIRVGEQDNYGEPIHTLATVKIGGGDICRLIGLTKKQIKDGVIDNKKWKRNSTIGETNYPDTEYLWTTVNGIPGRYTASRLSYDSEEIEKYFLPAAGIYHERGGIKYQGTQGYYYNMTTTAFWFDEIEFDRTKRNWQFCAIAIRCMRQ